MIEIFLGLMAAIMVAYFPISIASALIIGIAFMTICALTDFDAMLLHLPVMLMIGGIVFGLFFLPFWPLSPLAAILGIITPLVLITVINLIYMVVRGKTGFGRGDYWLLGAVCLWMGPLFSTALFFLAAILGADVGIAVISLKKRPWANSASFRRFHQSCVYFLADTQYNVYCLGCFFKS